MAHTCSLPLIPWVRVRLGVPSCPGHPVIETARQGGHGCGVALLGGGYRGLPQAKEGGVGTCPKSTVTSPGVVRGRGVGISLHRSQEPSKPWEVSASTVACPAVGCPQARMVLIRDALMTLSPLMVAHVMWSSLGLASPGLGLRRWRWQKKALSLSPPAAQTEMRCWSI